MVNHPGAIAAAHVDDPPGRILERAVFSGGVDPALDDGVREIRREDRSIGETHRGLE